MSTITPRRLDIHTISIVLLPVLLILLQATTLIQPLLEHSHTQKALLDDLAANTNTIKTTRLASLVTSWDSTGTASRDYTAQEVAGWIAREGAIVHTVPGLVEISLESGKALASRPWLDNIEHPLRILVTAVVRANTSHLYVQPGVLYEAEAPGLVTAVGPLGYGTVLPYLARGEAWILAPATGELRLYSPSGTLNATIHGLYQLSPHVAGLASISSSGPIILLGQEPVEAVYVHGGSATPLVEELDGLHATLTPGNPLLLTVEGRGAITVHLARGGSRAPTLLTISIYEGGRWVLVDQAWLTPSKGRISFIVDPGQGGLVMLESSRSLAIDMVAWTSMDMVLSLDPARLARLSFTMHISGGEAIVRYDPLGPGEVLARVSAPAEIGYTRILGGPHLTVYGDLWIPGEPIVGRVWMPVASDVAEVPPGARRVAISIAAYGEDGGSSVLVSSVRPLLYPVIASAGYPVHALDYSIHTGVVAGIEAEGAGERVEAWIRFVVLGAIFSGSEAASPPSITGGEILLGAVYNASGCEVPPRVGLDTPLVYMGSASNTVGYNSTLATVIGFYSIVPGFDTDGGHLIVSLWPRDDGLPQIVWAQPSSEARLEVVNGTIGGGALFQGIRIVVLLKETSDSILVDYRVPYSMGRECSHYLLLMASVRTTPSGGLEDPIAVVYRLKGP